MGRGMFDGEVKLIEEFLDKLEHEDALDASLKDDLLGILHETPAPRGGGANGGFSPFKELWRWLRPERGDASGAGEMAGKLDNLLVALRGFGLFFTVTALAPVLILYRRWLWAAPFFLVNPFLHLYASKIVAKRRKDPDRASEFHTAAGIVAIVPLGMLYFGLKIHFKVDVPFAALPLAWLGYAAVLALAVRHRRTAGLLLGAAVVSASMLMFCQNRVPVVQALAGLNALMALLFALGAELYPGMDAAGRSLGRRRAVTCMGLSCALSGLFSLLSAGWGTVGGGGRGVAWGVLAAAPLLVAIMWLEAKRLSGGRLRMAHLLVNLAAAWVFVLLANFGLVPVGYAEETGMSSSGTWVVAGCLSCLLASWSAWGFLGCRLDGRRSDGRVLEMSVVGLVISFAVVTLAVVRYGFLWPAGLLAGAAVFLGSLKELKRVRRVPLDGEMDESDA